MPIHILTYRLFMSITSLREGNPTTGGVAYAFSLPLRKIAMIVCRKKCDVLNTNP